MKNLQKGSATTWAIAVIVLVVLVGCGVYVFNNSEGCRITDSSGKATYHNPCPKSKPDYTLNANDNTDLGRIQRAMKEQASKYLSSAPSGFLKPTTVPAGYKPQPHPYLFEVDAAEYYFTTNKGVPTDKNLIFEESGGSGTFGNYDLYMAYKSKDANVKIVKEFTYNNMEGKVYTYTTNPNPNYTLAYNHNGRLLRITATNDSAITPDILVSLLEAMTVSN